MGSWKVWVMVLVILHIVAGFAWFIWKLEIQGREKESTKSNQDNTKKEA